MKPEIWGPHYWFFLHTMAYTYPETPNEIIKRKYYDSIMNFPLFIPDEKIGKKFAELLDAYPCQTYMNCRESFVRWVHCIHNKVNIHLKKPEIPLLQSIDEYVQLYQRTQKPDEHIEKIYYIDVVLYSIIIIILCIIIYCSLFSVNVFSIFSNNHSHKAAAAAP